MFVRVVIACGTWYSLGFVVSGKAGDAVVERVSKTGVSCTGVGTRVGFVVVLAGALVTVALAGIFELCGLVVRYLSRNFLTSDESKMLQLLYKWSTRKLRSTSIKPRWRSNGVPRPTSAQSRARFYGSGRSGENLGARSHYLVISPFLLFQNAAKPYWFSRASPRKFVNNKS